MVGRYPQAALFLELPPEMVDVNVHPTKAEVRFQERDRIFSGVRRATRRALLAHTPVPGIGMNSAGIPEQDYGFTRTNPPWSPVEQGTHQGQLDLEPELTKRELNMLVNIFDHGEQKVPHALMNHAVDGVIVVGHDPPVSVENILKKYPVVGAIAQPGFHHDSAIAQYRF